MHKLILHIILIITIGLQTPVLANVYVSNEINSISNCHHLDQDCCNQKESRKHHNSTSDKMCKCCHAFASTLFVANTLHEDDVIFFENTQKTYTYSTPNLPTSFDSIWNPPQ